MRSILLVLLLLGGSGPRPFPPDRDRPAGRPVPMTATPLPTPDRPMDLFADPEVTPSPLPLATASPTPTLEPPLSDRIRWAHIVSGESGGGWLEGSRLVAWTLRAWEVYRGMPAELAGPRWGWHGWGEVTAEARQVVNEVWGQDPASAPFAFMQAGQFCFALGSNQDADYFRSLGWYDQSDFHITHPLSPQHWMHCYFTAP